MKNRSGWLNVLLLFIVSALTYLPFVAKFGYYNDDWYLMYSVGSRGPGVFWEIFGVDRPLRALVMIPAYRMFGANPLLYNLSAYVFRLLGALALLWTLQILWPRQRTATRMMALLFLIYPGFLSQPNAIDYQSHIVGLASALLSIVCTLKAISSEYRRTKIIFHVLSVLLGWLYLGQMEWYIGFEFLRWACVLLLSSRSNGTLIQKVGRAVQQAYPSLIAPIGFLIWRLFFFHVERGATDLSEQIINSDLSLPVNVLTRLVSLIKDIMNVLIVAWGVPVYQMSSGLDLKTTLAGFAVAALCVICVLLSFYQASRSDADDADSNWQNEAIWLGLSAVLFGLLPVTLVNRHITFPSYSRYTVVASAGAMIALVGALYYFPRRNITWTLISAFVAVASFTHFANGFNHAQVTAAMNNFWWQVSWRVPQLEVNTTLVAHYPIGAAEEDYFVWGPANLIYYPRSQNPEANRPAIYAAVLNADTITNVLTRQRQEFDNRRHIITYKNYRNILILTQPSLNSCVQVIDGESPYFSSHEWDSVRVIGSYSELEHLLTDQTTHTPPTIVFGPEPSRGWCYYYEKADLARQRGDWDQVFEIGEQAFGRRLRPGNLIEWMPFLQAYAVRGDVDRLTRLAPTIVSDPYIAQQACQILSGVKEVSEGTKSIISALYCISN